MANTICRICLCTDRTVKTAKQVLSDFHDELCDFTLCAYKPQYCLECEYLLQKMFKFKLRCVMAAKIFQNWKKTKVAERQPVTHLYTLLPPSSLGHWTENNNKIYTFEEENKPSSSTDVETLIFIDPLMDCEKNCTENKLAIKDIKLEPECETDFTGDILYGLDSIKIEASSISLDDNDNASVLNDIEEFKEKDILKGNEDRNEIGQHVGKNFKDIKTIPLKKEISNDHDSYKVEKKSTLTELANITFSDDDFMDDVKETVEQTGAVKKVVKKSVNKKQKLNDGLVELRGAKKVVKKSVNKKRKLNDMQDEHSKASTKKKPKFTKERLLAELDFKFEVSDELKTRDGKTIDGQYVIDRVEDSLTLKEMRQLWRVVTTKTFAFTSKALTLLESVQKIPYKNEYKMYETVFDIERYKNKVQVMQGFKKRATYDCYVNAPYKCELCYQGFQYEKNLTNHKPQHDESNGPFACEICRAYFITSKRLSMHTKTHKLVFKCKLCPLVTYYKTSMINHYDQHEGKKYTCVPCGTVYRSSSSYNTHLMICKSEKEGKMHVCEECGRRFRTGIGLRRHYSKIHQVKPGDKILNCKKCELSFPSPYLLRTHMREAHKTILRSKGPALGTPSGNIFKCRECNATGRSNGWLSLHFRLEHPTIDMNGLYADKKKHLCDICGKGFSTVYGFRDHLNVHNGVRPYACRDCPKRFHGVATLHNHATVHAPPANPCSICGKKFRTKANLTNHMRTHIGNRCYKCNLCDKDFLHQNSLNEHVRGVHHHIRRKKKGDRKTGTRGVKESEEDD